jgi:hypothetical protein
MDKHVADIRKAIRAQRDLGKAIGYISIPISTIEGGYFGVNSDTANDVGARLEARMGKDLVWTLNPGAKEWSLPGSPTGADYMFMWATVLEGTDSLGSDFDFFYFVGPSDFAALLKLDGTADMQKLEAYYDKRAATDPGITKVDKRAFRNFYALRASVAFSPATSAPASPNRRRLAYSAACLPGIFGTEADAAAKRGESVTLSASAASLFSMILAMIACPARSKTARLSIRNFCDSRSFLT